MNGKVSKIKVIKLHGEWLLGRTYNDRGMTRLHPLLESGYFLNKTEAVKALDKIDNNTEKIDELPSFSVRHLPSIGG